MPTVTEVTSQAIADLIEYYKPAGGRIDQLESNLTKRGVNALYPPAPYVAAKGDGTNDDSVVIQNLVNAFKCVYLPIPSISYKFLTTVTLTEGQRVYGAGPASTVIDVGALPVDSFGFVVKSDNSLSVTLYAQSQPVIEGLSITCKTQTRNVNVHGIKVMGAFIVIRDVYISNIGKAIELGTTHTFLDTFDNVTIFNNDIGLNAPKVILDSGESVRFIGGSFNNNNIAVRAHYGWMLRFYGTSIDYNAKPYVSLEAVNPALLFFYGCHLETDSTHTSVPFFDVDTGVTGLHVELHGCTIWDASNTGQVTWFNETAPTKGFIRTVNCYPASQTPGFTANLFKHFETDRIPTVIANNTVYGSISPGNMTLYVPITLNPTASSPATCEVRLWRGDKSENKLFTITAPANSPAGQVQPVMLRIPAGYFYKFIINNSVIGVPVFTQEP